MNYTDPEEKDERSWIEKRQDEDIEAARQNNRTLNESYIIVVLNKSMVNNMNENNRIEEEIPLVVEEEIENLYSKIEYLVKRIDEIYDVLLPNKIEEVVVEEEVTPLDATVYKAKMTSKRSLQGNFEYNELVMISVGKINELGEIELYAIETHAPIIPNLYSSEFYFTALNNEDNKYWNSPKVSYKKFTPKNSINQIIVKKEDVELTTGYINENGVAIYYDQFPQKISE